MNNPITVANLLSAESVLKEMSQEMAAEYEDGRDEGWSRESMLESVNRRAALNVARRVLVDRAEAMANE